MNFDTLEADVNMLVPVHYTSGRGGNQIEYIGIHYNAGDLTVEGCYNVWLTREASAHYQVESNGRTGQLVWDGNTAWALGNFSANQKSINIEHANKADGTITEACLDTGAHLVAALCKYYGLGRPEWDVNVFPHKHFSATSCPGQIYGSQKDAYIQRAQMWYDKMVNPEPAPKPVTPLPDALKNYTDLDPDAWYIGALEKAVEVEFEHPYEDVTADPYYYDSVLWAKDEGIVSSTNEEFHPNDPCTRQDFIGMLWNWKGEPTESDHTDISDWSSVSGYAQAPVAWALDNKVISGSGNVVRPLDPCTRAEAAAMLVNLLG